MGSEGMDRKEWDALSKKEKNKLANRVLRRKKAAEESWLKATVKAMEERVAALRGMAPASSAEGEAPREKRQCA